MAATAAVTRAQTTGEPPLQLSLVEALQRAARSSDELALASANVDAARAQQAVARSDYYPQVSVSLSYERTLASEYDALLSAPASDMGAALPFGELPFGQENIYRASVSVVQNVFAGGRTAAGTRAAHASLEQTRLSLGGARAQTALAAVEAYYDALLCDRFVAISTQILEQAQATLQLVQLSRREGQESEFELLQARVALDNQRPNWVLRRMQQRLAYLRLNQQLGISADRQLALTSSLEESAPVPGDEGAILDPATRAVVRQAEYALRASEANVDAARSGYYPSVSLATTYGRVNYPGGALPTLNDWRENWTVGGYVSWAPFEGFRTRGQVSSAQAALGQARARLSQTQKLALYETRAALEQIEAARAVYEATASTAEQAKRAYAIAELRYREGVSTQLELTDARLSLAEAEMQRAQAKRDLEVARVRRALLPDLPLENTPAVATQSAAASSAAVTGSPASTSATPSPSMSGVGASSGQINGAGTRGF